jgi:hypothetical protein
MHEAAKSVIQREMITVNDILTKDVRMAGLNLPGNGIRITINANSNDLMEIYTNDSGYETMLSAVPGYSDSIMRVQNGTGMHSEHWICLNIPSTDTVYRQIKRVGMNASGADTIFLYERLNLTLSSLTKLYPSKRVKYYINPSPRGLVRSTNGIAVPLGSTIDTLEFIPKSLAGTVLGNMGKSAAVLSIFIGGRLKSGNSFSVISDSVEVNLRNRG